MRKGDDMDMNWQAMLHEAANASFEKDLVDTASGYLPKKLKSFSK